MRLQLGYSFEADYAVEVPVDMPSAIDYDIHQPGMMPRADLVLEVTTGDGGSWTGGVRAGGRR